MYLFLFEHREHRNIENGHMYPSGETAEQKGTSASTNNC